MATSNAVGAERISKVVGYDLTKGNFANTTPNLPQRIAILAEANTANQGTLSLVPTEITSAQRAGELYGYGSPIYNIMRILRPNSGDGVGGIPTIVYPQAEAGGAVAKILNITPAGTATNNGTHSIYLAGRNGLDGVFYDINIASGDTASIIQDKIVAAINNVLGCPVVAAKVSANVTLTAKWKGLTSNDLTVIVNNNGNDYGITYTYPAVTVGSGTPSVQAALELFGSEWNTIVINSYGTVSAVLTALEAFNGRPRNGSQAPTGRYAGIIMKPFIAFTGSTLEDPSSITDARKDDLTIAICAAPLSAGLPMEAAANVAVLSARVAQDTPHLDVNDMYYPDMPVPTSIGAMAVYTNRDAIVKKGCSTVDMVGGRYRVMDFVTTYHPVGETPPQFRYVRNLFLDFNVRFGYYLLEQINVVNKVIAADDDIVTASDVIKPKVWKQIVGRYADDLAARALIADADFMRDSIIVGISGTNPDRLDSFFRYKRTGVARIASTTAEAGFNFGNV